MYWLAMFQRIIDGFTQLQSKNVTNTDSQVETGSMNLCTIHPDHALHWGDPWTPGPSHAVLRSCSLTMISACHVIRIQSHINVKLSSETHTLTQTELKFVQPWAFSLWPRVHLHSCKSSRGAKNFTMITESYKVKVASVRMTGLITEGKVMGHFRPWLSDPHVRSQWMQHKRDGLPWGDKDTDDPVWWFELDHVC